MFKTRAISGAVLMAIALITFVCGGPILFFTMLVVSLIGMFELYRVMNVTDTKYSPLAITGFIGAVVYYSLVYFNKDEFALIELAFTLIALMAVYVLTFPRYKAEQTMAAFFAIFYAAVMLSCVVRTRSLDGGKYAVWLILGSSWGCDTCAYLTGRAVGKHKMAPVLSPKKTIEGGIGGVAGAALIGAVYALVLDAFHVFPEGAPVGEYALICGCGGLISMIGDLGASAIKRNHNIKDYGNLIPGHGGILDRFDSVIFTAPIIYFLARILL